VTTIKLEGEAQLMAALRKLGADVDAEVDIAVEATAIELRGEIVKGYQRGPKTGVTYEKYNPRRTHTASAAGEAPATDTGRTASATQYSKTGKGQAEVSNDVETAPMLEFGTQNIKPRPNWRPKTIEAAPKFNKRLEAALRKAMGT
jgi:hypothetical protein